LKGCVGRIKSFKNCIAKSSRISENIIRADGGYSKEIIHFVEWYFFLVLKLFCDFVYCLKTISEVKDERTVAAK
jgi:hypothetical protein